MKIYDFILQGHEATEENAKDHARGQDWQSMTKTENDSLPHTQYIDTINGVEIWYCIAGDCYIFSDETDDY